MKNNTHFQYKAVYKAYLTYEMDGNLVCLFSWNFKYFICNAYVPLNSLTDYYKQIVECLCTLEMFHKTD